MVVEFHETMAYAILREKRIKKWRRTWKLELIERHNRQWRDLYEELGESARPLFMPRQALGPRLRRGDEQVERRTLIFPTRYQGPSFDLGSH